MKALYLAAAVVGISCAGHSSVPIPVRLPAGTADSLAVALRVDSSQHEIIIDAGPFDVPAMAPMAMGGHGMQDMDMDMGGGGSMSMGMHHIPTKLLRFNWPVNGWLRGYRLIAVDAEGHVLPSTLLHHVIGVNFERRQLIYDALERPFAVGSETGEVKLPKTIALPLTKGDHMGMWGAWHNETGKNLHNVYLRAILYWTPATTKHHPIAVLPFYADVNYKYGADNAFDLPPGHSVWQHDFTQPIGGLLLGIGGHLHDYGVSVSLEDAETGDTLVTLDAQKDSTGHVTGVGRKLFPIRGLRLKAGHRYRIVGVYDNPLPDTIKLGAMAHMVGVFAPDDPSQWPAIDRDDANFQKDVAGIPPLGATAVVLSLDAGIPAERGTLSSSLNSTRQGTGQPR
ncbi:MAG TPA: hypothetical protein VFW98_14610 [Gemmatimonadaceae bacterium]|nr:hypothetical protein [Gemmatimonadaceae bacterium]